MLVVKNIKFSYGKTIVFSNIEFELKLGKSLAIIGESGCGKSTLLKLIYGLYDLDEGKITWNKTPVFGPKYNLIPGMSFMKYLAQDFDLMPFTTVSENIGTFLSNINLEVKKARISELLEVVEMSEFSQTKVKFLSGGQMQRVAIAKVLALEPEVLLLDEPFSHIDTSRKNELRRKLFSYLKQNQTTVLIATHDVTDILSFSDEILVLKDGKICQYGVPEMVYKNPISKYTASLFDDVTEININGKIQFLYPNQIIVVPKSDYRVKVINSFFKGNYYLIEAFLDSQILFFNYHSRLEKDRKVCLEFILF